MPYGASSQQLSVPRTSPAGTLFYEHHVCQENVYILLPPSFIKCTCRHSMRVPSAVTPELPHRRSQLHRSSLRCRRAPRRIRGREAKLDACCSRHTIGPRPQYLPSSCKCGMDAMSPPNTEGTEMPRRKQYPAAYQRHRLSPRAWMYSAPRIYLDDLPARVSILLGILVLML
jgi:hypothetical protein